jgi:hypothetical protein
MKRRMLDWLVCIRDQDGLLIQVAEVDEEPRAQLFVSALKEAGVDAFHFKQEVAF